jgi:dipeptidyl aminopeptidase/acylaminoacyl peptidase
LATRSGRCECFRETSRKLEDRRELTTKVNRATHADPGDPPVLILHGDAEPLIAFKQSELLYQALKAAGAEVMLGVAKGGSHERHLGKV